MVKTKKRFMVFLIGLLFIPIAVRATTTTDSFKRTFISSYGYVDTKGHHGNFERFHRESDNKIAYCIEPGVSFSSEEYNGFYDLTLDELAEIADLSEGRLNEASLYAYFGYGYHAHSGDDWVIATQALIWEALGRDFLFTNGYHPSNPEDYVIEVPDSIQQKIDYILEKVDDFKEEPDFSTDHAIISKNQTFDYGKLNGFDVVECENCTYEESGGRLVITPTDTEGKVYLQKTLDDYNSTFVVYTRDDGQNMMATGNVEPLTMEVSFEVVSGSLLLKKFDADSKTCKPKDGGKLEGSVYGLYKEDGTYVKDLVIGADCSANVSDLELGNYYIQEKEAGLNYELDSKKYSFQLTEENSSHEMVVYDKMYLGQIELKKVDSNTKTCESSSFFTSLKGAVYGLYNDKDELIEKLEIDSDCKVKSKRNLLLGNYYLKEIKAPLGYQLDTKKHKFTVSKDNADGIISLEVEDHIYETKVEITKNYSYFNYYMAEENAQFEVLRKDTLERIALLTTDSNGQAFITLPYGNYIIKQISGMEGYYFSEDIEIIVDEKTEDVTPISIVNEPYRGSLVFTKTDLLTGALLPNVFIEVYNELGELTYKGFTDNNGQVVINGLPIGMYTLIETKPLDGYYPYLEPISFAITKENEVVEVSLENEQMVVVPDTFKNELNCSSVYGFFFLLLGSVFLRHGKKM